MEKHYFEDRFEVHPSWANANPEMLHRYYKEEDVVQLEKRNKKLIEKINEDVLPELIESKNISHDRGQYNQSQYYDDLINDLKSIISEIEGE